MLTRLKIESVDHAVKLLREHHEMVEQFYDDPMTEAMGAPTGDFQRDFDAKERGILAYIIKNAPQGSEAYENALVGMEKWMP